MLVLTRKEGEQICIGDDIRITVVRAGGERMRLGIEAPPNTVILRSELKPSPSELANFPYGLTSSALMPYGLADMPTIPFSLSPLSNDLQYPYP